jgi:ABC-type molybdate transport system ATPase subunit
MLGLDTAEAQDANRLARALEVGHLLSKPSGKVSVGEAQRICLARTLASKAPLVLLDEPLAPINAASRGEVAEIIRQRTADRSLLWATHSVDAVRAIADRLVVIDGGTVLQEGSVNEVLGNPINGQVADIIGAS